MKEIITNLKNNSLIKNLFIYTAIIILLFACTKEKSNLSPNGQTVLKFATDRVRVPKSGGTFSIKIETNTQYKQGVATKQISQTPKPDIYTKINIVENKFSSNEMTVRIAASSGVVMDDSTIVITSPDGKDTASIVIEQDGDPSMAPFDEKLKNFKISTMAAAAETLDLMYSAEANYTKTSNINWGSEFYQKPVSTGSNIIRDMWSRAYKAIRYTNVFIHEPGIPDSLKASFITLRSILYYNMGLLWKDIPYITTYEIQFTPSQIPYDELLRELNTSFSQSATILKNEKIDNGYIISADVPKQMQSKVLMNQQKYIEALVLLNNIINSNRYILAANRDVAFKSTNSELIQGISVPENNAPFIVMYKQINNVAEIFPIARFTETIMLAAECNLKLNDNTKVISLLNSIEVARGRAPRFAASTVVTLDDLQKMWLRELYSEFSYFDFLKRNNLAESVLGIPSYQKVLPFPAQEIILNPNMRQNAGY